MNRRASNKKRKRPEPISPEWDAEFTQLRAEREKVVRPTREERRLPAEWDPAKRKAWKLWLVRKLTNDRKRLRRQEDEDRRFLDYSAFYPAIAEKLPHDEGLLYRVIDQQQQTIQSLLDSVYEMQRTVCPSVFDYARIDEEEEEEE